MSRFCPRVQADSSALAAPPEPAELLVEPWRGGGLTAGLVTLEGLGPRRNRTMPAVLLRAGNPQAFSPRSDMKAFIRGKVEIAASHDNDPLAFFFRVDTLAWDSAMTEACQGIVGDAAAFAIIGDETRLAAVLDPVMFASLADWVRQLPE